jgi:hypothetical protein
LRICVRLGLRICSLYHGSGSFSIPSYAAKRNSVLFYSITELCFVGPLWIGWFPSIWSGASKPSMSATLSATGLSRSDNGRSSLRLFSALWTIKITKLLARGQIRRAKKALIDLSIAMLDEKDSNSNAAAIAAHRNRSFGRNNASGSSSSSSNHNNHRSSGLAHFRSLSWSVSRSWSAARQLQAIGNNLVAPKGNELVASNGLAVSVFTMNWVLLLTMWALVAAIPCQDRGLQVHFYIPRQLVWAGPVLSVHERILEESKKRDRRNACGLLKEIHQIEKCTRLLSELPDSLHFPIMEEKEAEVRHKVQELSHVYLAIKEGLDPLEQQVREVFHRIVRSRTQTMTIPTSSVTN